MATNNFKLLEAEMESKFEDSSEAIKKNINDQRGVWSLIGDLFELYIPRIFSALVGSNISMNGRGGREDIKKD